MKAKMKRTITLLLALMLCLSALPAASATDQYRDFAAKCEEGDLKGAMSSYESFQKKLDKEWTTAQGNMSGALKKNNAKLYNEARDEMRKLSQLNVTREQTDELLALIVNDPDEERRIEEAQWLYDISPYYRPSLSISLSSKGSNHRYDYSSSFSLKPGTSVRLPLQSDLKVDTTLFGRLAGWGITPDEILYQPGETILMPLTDHELYAVWETGVGFTAKEAGIETFIGDVQSGDTVPVPELVDADGRYYLGWHENSTGEFISKDTIEYDVRGNGGDFESVYVELECSNQSIAPYTQIPKATQVSLCFEVENLGNYGDDSIKVTLSSPEKGIKFLNETAYFRRLPAGSTGTVRGMRFVVGDSIPSGTIIPIDVTLEDAAGRTWTDRFEFEVR